MTIGERNRAIIKKYEQGCTEAETAKYIVVTENVVAKVISSYRKNGSKIFNSTNDWDGTEDDLEYVDAISMAERAEIDSLRYGKKLEIRRMSIRKGQTVTFLRDGNYVNGEVIEEPRDTDHTILVRIKFANGNSYTASPMIDDILRAERGEI